MTEQLRKSGIDVMGDISWGYHFCQFYETKKDLLELLVPYFQAGLENNEFCLWVTSDPITVEDAFHALERTVPGFNHLFKNRSMEIIASTDLYPSTGEFDAKEIMRGLDEKLNQALAAGFDGLRANGIESWLENERWDNFMKYEGELNSSLLEKRMIILCAYPLMESPGSSILDVAHVHQRVIAKRKGNWEVLEEPELNEIKSELIKANHALEQKVTERTRELLKTIEHLETEISERKKIENELKSSELRYRTLVEQASDAILITDQHGNLLEENPSFCKMFGYSEKELNKMNMASLVAPGELKTDPLRFDLLLEGSAIFRERRMRKRDGTIFNIEEHVKMLPDGRILAIVRDITERKKSEDELQLAYQRLSFHVDNTPLAVIELDPDLNISRWSKRAEEIFGWKSPEILGKNMYKVNIIYEADLPAVRKIAGDLTQGLMERNVSLNRNFTKDHQVIYCEWYNSVLRDDQGKVITILSLVDNVTERKKAEDTLSHSYQEIRSLTEHLQNIREEERKRIAREIHDELGQHLTVLKMDVSWLNKKLKSTDEVVENKLKDLNHLLDSMVLAVRKISYELRPILLDEFGLAAAMEWYLKEFEKRSGIRTYFNQPKQELKLNDAVKTNLFRIFQESLTNIARHSDAREVTIDLTQNRELHLRIQDNGKGFNKEKITNNKTLGILGMKERASSLGWHYEIQTETGSGTTVSVVIPPVKKPYL